MAKNSLINRLSRTHMHVCDNKCTNSYRCDIYTLEFTVPLCTDSNQSTVAWVVRKYLMCNEETCFEFFCTKLKNCNLHETKSFELFVWSRNISSVSRPFWVNYFAFFFCLLLLFEFSNNLLVWKWLNRHQKPWKFENCPKKCLSAGKILKILLKKWWTTWKISNSSKNVNISNCLGNARKYFSNA